jgi:hypothetical protein
VAREVVILHSDCPSWRIYPRPAAFTAVIWIQ